MRSHIENLIAFELKQGVIDIRDYHYVKNQIYYLLKIELDNESFEPIEINYPSDALEPILDELETRGILDGSKLARDLMDAKIMNVFAKMPSDVENYFYQLLRHKKDRATHWYYHYMQDLNYIRMDRILKNQSFKTPSKYGYLDITINLSKPEKDPKSIILAGKSISKDYLNKISLGYNEFIKTLPNENVLIIDISGKDFVENHEDYLEVLKLINNKIKQIEI